MEGSNEQNGQVSSQVSDLASALEGISGAADILKSFELPNNQDDKGKNPNEGNPVSENDEVAVDDVVEKNIPKKNIKKDTITEDREEDEGEDEEEKGLEEEEDVNPLLKAIKGKKNKETEIDFKSFDEIKAHAKKVLGIEVKNEKDFNKVFSSAQEWRKSAQKAEELETTVNQFQSLFEKMPKSLLDSIKSYFNNDENWDSPIVSRPKFDFTKGIDHQDIKSLVNHYFPGKFTDEHWNTDMKPEALEIAMQASKDRFNYDKKDLEKESAEIVRKSAEDKERRTSSIDSSLKSLKQSFPNMDNIGLKKISNILDSGDVTSIFFDKNGSYKPDAAKKIMMAMYGEGTIKNLMKASAKKAESEANEDILSRGADKPKPQKGGAQNVDISEKTTKLIDEITGGLNRRNTY